MLADLVAAIDPEHCESLAERLLSEHRTLARLFAQSPEALERTLGKDSPVGAMIAAAHRVTLEAMREEISGRGINPENPKLLRYLTASMGGLPDEALRVLFLDPSHQLIADEQLQHGTLGHLAIYPRTIFRRAIELDAAAIILVHNHPSGDPTPSRPDIEATEHLATVGQALNVEVLEHIVIALGGHRTILNRRAACGTAPATALRDRGADWRSTPDAGLALANAQRAWRRRLLRRQLVGADSLFGEPAWEMLIDLFIHEAAAKSVSTSSLCIASGLPRTTALRLLQRLCDEGLVVREPDRHDGRRNFIRLAPDLAPRLLAYFAAGDE
jgi:DNA repair protein RadC